VAAQLETARMCLTTNGKLAKFRATGSLGMAEREQLTHHLQSQHQKLRQHQHTVAMGLHIVDVTTNSAGDCLGNVKAFGH
jgi:hypothetical protein